MKGIVRYSGLLSAAMLVMVLLTGVNPVRAGGTGLYGYHDHGATTCYSGGKISVRGPLVAAYNYTNYRNYNDIYYKAHLYKWQNGSWTRVLSTEWKWKGHWIMSPEYLPNSSFTVGSGYWKVSTQINWYGTYAKNYLGASPNTWTTGGYCTYY